jgi:hypothetical protein
MVDEVNVRRSGSKRMKKKTPKDGMIKDVGRNKRQSTEAQIDMRRCLSDYG